MDAICLPIIHFKSLRHFASLRLIALCARAPIQKTRAGLLIPWLAS
jgi:hypothetical protein